MGLFRKEKPKTPERPRPQGALREGTGLRKAPPKPQVSRKPLTDAQSRPRKP